MTRIKELAIRLWTNDLFERAFSTFWQTSLVVWAAADFEPTTVAVTGALAAGLSAVKNLLKKRINRVQG